MQILTDIHQHYKRFAPDIQSITTLTPSMPFGKGFQWRETRRVLYLREDCIFTVQDYNVRDTFFMLGSHSQEVFHSFALLLQSCFERLANLAWFKGITKSQADTL